MEPEQVLELIRSAPERYESVRAALRYLGDGPAHKEIHERIVRRAFRVSPEEAFEPIRNPEPDGPFGWRCRAWHADNYHWRMETEVPGGGVEITASKGRRRLPIGGPSGSGLVWNRRVGAGSRQDDPRWFMQATDHYWTFYPLLTDEICGISHELRSLNLTVEGPVVWVGREAVRLVGVPGTGQEDPHTLPILDASVNRGRGPTTWLSASCTSEGPSSRRGMKITLPGQTSLNRRLRPCPNSGPR